MKYFSLILLFVLTSCSKNKSVLLPKSDVTLVKEINDLSPVYIFFKIIGKDTIAEVNRNNTIISTNWVFNIDKRLPLRLVIPEVVKLQQKKRGEVAHKNEVAQNYYTYTDTIAKKLAFMPFTNVYYKLEKPNGKIIYFNKKNEIILENNTIKKEDLQVLLSKQFTFNKSTQLIFQFDKSLDFGSYIQDKIFIENLKLKINSKEEFIY